MTVRRDPLREEMLVVPAAVETELVGMGVGGAGVVEQPRLRIGIVERRAYERIGVDAVLHPDRSADAVEIEAVRGHGRLPIADAAIALHVEGPRAHGNK